MTDRTLEDIIIVFCSVVACLIVAAFIVEKVPL